MRELRLVLAVILVAPAFALSAAAHDGHPPGTEPDVPTAASPDDDTLPPSVGYTGPGRTPYINFYEGVWFYGTISAAPVGNQYPVNIHGSGDWLAWEDARRGDIFAFNIPAGVGQYLTADRGFQRNVAIADDVVVWEDYRNSTHADVYAYFLQTGEMRRISSGPGNHLNPDVRGNMIVWEDTRDGNGDIWGYNLDNKTQFPIYVGPDKESDPVIVGSKVYFRTYRFNIWDVMAVDLEDGSLLQATSDVAIQSAPFTNGTDVFFLTQFFTAWNLERFDSELEEVAPTSLKFQDTKAPAVSGDHLLTAPLSGVYRQILAINLTSSSTQHVSGNMPITSEPYLDGRTAYLAFQGTKGVSLVTLQISPFAFSKPPTITLNSPRTGSPWLQPVIVDGVLQAEGDWGEPSTFTYRVDDGAPTALPVEQAFRFTLDPEGVAPGRHAVTIRATYRDGPPAEAQVLLVIPSPASTIDIAESAQAFHAARVIYSLNTWFIQNPASYFVILIALIVIGLLALRWWLARKPRREKLLVEYVAQDEA